MRYTSILYYILLSVCRVSELCFLGHHVNKDGLISPLPEYLQVTQDVLTLLS